MSQFTLAVVHSMDLEKHVSTCTHCRSITQNSFAGLKFLHSDYLFLPAPLAPDNQ